MSNPRTKLPLLTAFGGVLRRLRQGRGVSTGWAEKELMLRAGASAHANRSTLSQYEKGRVWAPDPLVLSELAQLYDADVLALIAVLKANRQDPTLSLERADAIYEGARNVDTAATGLLVERQETERRLQDYEAKMSEVRAVATRLIGIAARGAEGRKARRTPAGRDERARGRHG